MLTLNASCVFAARLTVLLAPFSTAHANANAIDLPWKTGMAVGRGFDSAKASMDGFALALDPATSGAENLGPAVCPFERKFDMELVDNLTEYKRKVGVTAEAEINAVVASATGTLKFAEDTVKNNHSVYLMLRDERVNCHYRLKNPKLSPSAEAQLVANYPAFRQLFGDRFLSTVSTGGNFYAVMEVKATDETTRDELKFKLKAKVMGVTVFSWGMQKVFEDIVNENETSISVYFNNSVYEFGVTKDRLFELYDSYLHEVSSPSCSGTPLGHSACNYRKASFEDYQQLTRLPAGGGAELQTTIMDELAQRRRSYAEIVARAENVEAKINRYQYPVDDVNRLQKVQSLLADARAQATLLKNAYDACRTSATTCQASIQLSLLSEVSLERRFPVEIDRYPQTCKVLRTRHGVRRDGRMRLYWQAKRTQPFDVYCADMETSEPNMYLLLPASSAKTAHPDLNFARRIAPPDEAFSPDRTITSVFSGLHVRIANNQVIVLPQETGLVTHFGGPVVDGALEVRHADLVAPQTCDANGVQHLANLSLQGTPWVVSQQTVFASSVPSGSEGRWTVSADRKQLDAYGEGRTGCVELSVHGTLKLEYQP